MPWASSRSSAVASARVVERLRDERVGAAPSPARHRLVGDVERHDRVDESLLRAVVQVADDATALVVGGRHDPRPRGGEVRAGLEVGDRGRDQLGELRHPRFGVGGQRLRPALRGDHDAPSRPSTTIGQPTAARMPNSTICRRARRWPPVSSIRAGRPVRRTLAVDVLAVDGQHACRPSRRRRDGPSSPRTWRSRRPRSGASRCSPRAAAVRPTRRPWRGPPPRAARAPRGSRPAAVPPAPQPAAARRRVPAH